jgi:thiamine-monophosphate kinase
MFYCVKKKSGRRVGKDFFQPDLQEYEYVVQRQLMPTARHDLMKALKKSGIKPTSMVDVSQGLVNEIQILSETNKTGCEIFTPAVPVSLEARKIADEMKEDVDRYAFYGGEDFEILFTLKDEDVEKLKTEFDDFSVIGEIKPFDHGIVLNTGEGQSINLSESQDE